MKTIAGAFFRASCEELADARGAEAGEHLDERGRARGVEVRARLVRDRLREQRLAGAGRAVEQQPLRNLRPERLEALRIAEEVDDLLELGADFLDAGNVGPRRRSTIPSSPCSAASCAASIPSNLQSRYAVKPSTMMKKTGSHADAKSRRSCSHCPTSEWCGKRMVSRRRVRPLVVVVVDVVVVVVVAASTT